MTYFGSHDRTVVQGDEVCTCGNDWPCPQSAEGRWAALREWLREMDETYTGIYNASHAADPDTPAAASVRGRLGSARGTLAKMTELEGEQ